MSKQAFKYRLYPTKQQEQVLQTTLNLCRELYNASLEERKEAYRMSKVTITYNQQANQLPDIKAIRPEYNDIYSQVLQDTLRRVKKAMDNFFRRVKQGEKAGYPRFKSYNRFDSFTYPQSGFSLSQDSRVYLSKIGSIKVKLHRPIEGKMKIATIKREVDQWYIVFSCEVEEKEPRAATNEMVGIDLGVTHFAALSDGAIIANPRHLRHAAKRLKKLEQQLARKKKGSHRRARTKKQLAKVHRKIKNQRKDFLHKASRKLVNTYGILVFEKLQPANMTHRPKPKQDEETGKYLPNGAAAKAGLNKSILDAGWHQFQQYCTYKAESAGRSVLFVSPNYTSQVCSGCGKVRKKDLAERWHSCECGAELDRDHNAAINVLRLGSSQCGATHVEASCLEAWGTSHLKTRRTSACMPPFAIIRRRLIMTPQESADNSHAMTRRTFIKAGSLVVGGAAVSGLELETAPLAYAEGGEGRTLHEGSPAEVGMSQARLNDVAARVQNRIDRGLIPGAVIWVARHGKTVLHRAFGVREVGKDTMTEDTLFDLESNTKVLATAISYMILIERGVVHLSDRVAKYLPHFATNGKAHVTIRDMLRYSSGLTADIALPGAPNLADVPSPDKLWRIMEETPLEYPTGSKVEYSDLTYRLLGHVLEAATGQNLQQFAKANVWSKLGMSRTTYNPLDNGFSVSKIAATGPGSWNLRKGTIRGVVEDDFDWVMGGIVGCDGLFSTSRDIAVFLQMILNGGSYGGVRIISPSTVRMMTADQTPQVTEATDTDPISNLLFTHKGYGWELWTHRFSSGGMRLTPGSFGKAGGAGTFFWVDPRRDLFAIILTNHGLPVPFDANGWATMLDAIGVYQFFDGVINSLDS